MTEPGTRRCAVVGDPIEHSLSPVLHRAGYDALGLALEYDAVRVPAGGLAGFVAGLDPSWRGLSVTAPLKREAHELAGVLSDRARLAGGVNTLVRDDDGWRGDNTDLPGAVNAVRERMQAAGLDGSTLETGLVLGGGATAASLGLALAELGVTRLVLGVREPARAEEARARIASHPAVRTVGVLTLADLTGADVLVSTVPVSAQSPELVERVGHADVVFEATYNTWPTPLAEKAAQLGNVVVSGLDLLVHQAVLQFEMFTGTTAPLAAMREAGERALAARQVPRT